MPEIPLLCEKYGNYWSPTDFEEETDPMQVYIEADIH